MGDSFAAWQASDERKITGYIGAAALTDTFYIARRLQGLERAKQAVRACLKAFEICAVDRQALEQAERLPGNDFEDNLQIACAIFAHVDAILTRDGTGFEASPIPALSATELLLKLT